MIKIPTQSYHHTPVSGPLSGPSSRPAVLPSRYSVAPAGRARPVTITIQPPVQLIRSKRAKAHIDGTRSCDFLSKQQQKQASQRYCSNGWGSLKPHGLTWDVDVSAFMIRHLAPVPLSRRNVCLLHQKSPRHDQLTPARLTGTLGEINRLWRRGGEKCPEEETPKLEETRSVLPFPTFLLVSQGAVISPFTSSYNTPSPQSDLPSRMLVGGNKIKRVGAGESAQVCRRAGTSRKSPNGVWE